MCLTLELPCCFFPCGCCYPTQSIALQVQWELEDVFWWEDSWASNSLLLKEKILASRFWPSVAENEPSKASDCHFGGSRQLGLLCCSHQIGPGAEKPEVHNDDLCELEPFWRGNALGRAVWKTQPCALALLQTNDRKLHFCFTRTSQSSVLHVVWFSAQEPDFWVKIERTKAGWFLSYLPHQQVWYCYVLLGIPCPRGLLKPLTCTVMFSSAMRVRTKIQWFLLCLLLARHEKKVWNAYRIINFFSKVRFFFYLLELLNIPLK